MANYQRPRRPAFASALSPELVQLHSAEYRNLGQLRPGGVLLAGAGNSGAELAMEMVRGGHPTVIAGPDTGEAPFRMDGFLGRTVLARFLLRFVFHRLLTVRTPMGRKARPRILGKGVPLIRVKKAQLAAAGVERLPRVVGVRDGRPLLEGGRVLEVANVIWCTGFDPGFTWIDLPTSGRSGSRAMRPGW
jgi:putative flavoprotein involved in K+ transport